MPVSDVYDGDSAHIEYDNLAVTRIKWVESGLGVEVVDGGSRFLFLVPEDTRFTCGAALTHGRDLSLIFGEWVTARDARYGRPQ